MTCKHIYTYLQKRFLILVSCTVVSFRGLTRSRSRETTISNPYMEFQEVKEKDVPGVHLNGVYYCKHVRVDEHILTTCDQARDRYPAIFFCVGALGVPAACCSIFGDIASTLHISGCLHPVGDHQSQHVTLATDCFAPTHRTSEGCSATGRQGLNHAICDINVL